jgi:hypothetical protein
VRWGPLWAGLVTTLATFVLLQLVFMATKAVDIDLGAGDTSFSFWTAVSALVAFFVGGLVTGASTKWDRADDGAFQGVLLWALATVALLILGGLSARALAGPLGSFLNSATGASGIPAGPQREAALEAAQDRAAQALLSLFLALAASVAGAVAGSKLWPRRRTIDVRTRDVDYGTTARIQPVYPAAPRGPGQRPALACSSARPGSVAGWVAGSWTVNLAPRSGSLVAVTWPP